MLLIANPGQAEELTIAAGQTYQAQKNLKLERLVMEDGATLIAPQGIKQWQVEARQAWLIGNSYIKANGSAGTNGPHAAAGNLDNQTAPCETGQSGHPGNHGADGSDGIRLQLKLGIAHFDHLHINARGGEGGRGGSGSDGAPGGKARGCNGGDGGRGGDGGNGGLGGRGGDVTLHYWISGQQVSVPITNYGEGLIVSTAGGQGGTAGAAGEGGKGGKGRFEKRTTNITVTRESGKHGRAGQAGKSGQPGEDGKFRITNSAADDRTLGSR